MYCCLSPNYQEKCLLLENLNPARVRLLAVFYQFFLFTEFEHLINKLLDLKSQVTVKLHI